MKLRRAQAQVAEQREETPLEEVARLLKEERNKWRKRFFVWGVVIVAFGINQARIGGIANNAKHASAVASVSAAASKHALTVSQEQTWDARIGSCFSFNRELASYVNRLNDEVQKLAVDAFADATGQRTSAEQRLIDRFLAVKRSAFEADKVPLRDCTRAGIAKYIAAQGGTVQGSPTATTTIPATTTTAAHRSGPRPTASPTTRATSRPSTTSTTTERSTTTTLAPCTGVTLPGMLPCL